ncbi:MAG: sensor domain-containing phosphodiesterase [Oleiphilaceae bacterium]|nr:sensor domain-containing phosphodiesterase [Oleiphilaceae bacterium]
MSDIELDRLEALHRLQILDTAPEESFNRITRLASRLFDLPLAAISLTDTDRQWFKSRVGTDLREIPRQGAPCNAATADASTRVVEDIHQSGEYHKSPLAQMGIRFYAGAPLKTREGHILGTLCVMGYLPRRVSQSELESLQDLSAMVMTEIELLHAFDHLDATTGLPGSGQLHVDLQDLARDYPEAGWSALLTELLDVNQISLLSRVLGPASVDRMTLAGGQVLKAQCREEDRLYCIGPCQFLYVQRAESVGEVRSLAQRLHRQLMALNRHSGMPVTLSPRIGIVSIRPGCQDSAHILRMAHGACQDARNKDRGIAYHSPRLDARQKRAFTLLKDMRQALKTPRELQLVFQPRVALPQGHCVGAEALLRWKHPTLGAISPKEFIPLIENTPLAGKLTDWVLWSAIQQSAEWHHQGLPLRISVNIMASDLEDPEFTHQLLGWMDQCRLPREALELELTETALISSRRRVRRQLRALEAAGIIIAIDDFGTGYSSLSYLLDVPAKVIKIDRRFTMAYQQEERRTALLRALIGLAHEMGYTTVAEGFAPDNYLHTLQEMGCDEVQSFAIARPMPASDFPAWYEGFGQRSGPFPQRLLA